jgi:hypothetical protein
MSTNKLHNELYKLAIEMSRYNGKGVKQNLELLLSTMPVRKKERKNSIR